MSTWKDRFRAIISVYLIAKDAQGRVLFLRRQNTGFKDGELCLPAGHVDGQEELFLAMAREAREEVGIDVDASNLHLVHVMHRNCGDHERMDFFIETKMWSGEVQNTEPEKCSELVWEDLSSLPEDVMDYTKQAIALAQRGINYSSFGF